MSSIVEFNGSGDVIAWAAKVKAKLVAKGYKGYLIPKDLKSIKSKVFGIKWLIKQLG